MSEESSAYTGFAEVYDLFMENIPYQEWYACVRGILEEEGISDGLVLELGCGTGTFTELLAAGGYDMIGVDNSAEMLNRAMEKRADSGLDILYLLQDMREFELYGTVRAVVSVCDSMNYLQTEEDLRRVAACVNNYLDPGGIFIFDLKTAWYFRNVMGNQVFAEHRPQASYVWENAWYEEEQINEYDLTLFLREENGLFRRETETHVQKAWEPETVRRALEAGGLEFLACRAEKVHGASKTCGVEKRCAREKTDVDFSARQSKKMQATAESECERMYFVAREKGKKR